MFNRVFGPLFAAPPQPENVSVVEAAVIKGWVASGEAVLVDVREAREFEAEHIPGATSVPLSAFDPARLPALKGRKLVIHCRSGSRCGMAAIRLATAGFDAPIHRMQGGLIGWKSVGGKTTTG
ncbi:MAG: rhodanese-like domain-containing protein [Magnetospirillum sp.]|nr:rhodanese-like domain-containing protein [Magnetospirillum sp.]